MKRTTSCALAPGDVVVFNYGSRQWVESVTPVGEASVRVAYSDIEGSFLMRRDRHVAVRPVQGPAAKEAEMAPRHEFEGDRRCVAEVPADPGDPTAGTEPCNLLPEEHADPVTIATIETRNFTFEGVGLDEGEARDGLLGALMGHGAELGLDPGWYVPYLDDVHVRTVWPGAGYRDGEEVA